MRRIVRRGVLALAALCGVALATAVGLVGANNMGGAMPDSARLAASLDAATQWLDDNSAEILEVANPILWYFLQRAEEVSGDPRLSALLDAYRARYLAPYVGANPWAAMFDLSADRVQLDFADLQQFNYYSKHMVYAVNCDEFIGELPDIQVQNEPEFCGWSHLFRPTCTTHQLMGIRFLQRANCGDPERNQQTVNELQTMVRRELVYDPRVLDVYLQRAMTLVESGNPQAVKGVWIERILAVQNEDGGWGNFVSLVQLSDDLHVGFGYGRSRTGRPRSGKTWLKLFGVGQPRSTFHATAQGVLLLTLLTAR